jgi:hypothetical protein
MPILLCFLALTVFTGDLKPLPEERKLTNTEEVAIEYSRLKVAKLGAIGWTRTKVVRGQLNGATHYLVHRLGEIADFKAAGFTVIESRGLYDGDLKLVREMRRMEPLGADTKPLELEWGDKGFRWRRGRGRWTAGGAEVRPTAETDIALFVHGLAVETPWAGQVFDDKSESIQAQTLQPGTEKTIKDKGLMVFKVEGANPMTHYVSKSGVYLRSKAVAFDIAGLEREDDIDVTVRRGLADNEVFTQALRTQLPTGWTEKKRTYSHPTLGLSFKLPKGWQRANANEGVVFQAFSADKNAYLTVIVAVLGTGYDLDGWSKGLRNEYAKVAKGGEVKVKNKALGATKGIRFDYVFAQELPLDCTAYAWKRNGFGVVINGGTWEEATKKLRKETPGILKSVKVAR